MKKLLLKNGEVVSKEKVFFADILVSEGRIEKIFEKGKKYSKLSESIEEIDCKGKTILPGAIDAHVHFREPGEEYKEDWETGSKAAASGGVTTVFDMPNNKPPILTVKDLERKRKIIKGRSYVNYGLYMGCDGKNFEEINKAKAVGVKVYCSASNKALIAADLDVVFEKIGRDKLLVFHAEDQKCLDDRERQYLAEFGGRDIDPSVHSKIHAPECALIMVRKLCELARKHKRPIHICHITTEAEFDIISEYKKDGVTCETAPQYLVLSDDDYAHFGNFIKMNPAVRSRLDVFGVWKCLKSGLVDIIATDHAPHQRLEKSGSYLDVPSGVPGVEMLLPIFLNTVNDEGMTFEELVRLCCEKPAEIFGIKGKGRILEGYDADLVVVDMDLECEFKEEDIRSKCGWSPYTGSVFKGWPVMTFVNGELVFKDGKIVGKKAGREVEIEG